MDRRRPTLTDFTEALYDEDGLADEPRPRMRIAPSRRSLAVLAVTLAIVGGGAALGRVGSAPVIDEDVAAASIEAHESQSAPAPEPVEVPAPLVVHVSGAVASPGVVTLAAGERVVDAVTSAGGPVEDADLDAVNLARIAVDGEQIHVPRAGEVPAPTGDGGPGGAAQPACVDLNTADGQALQGLDGIGPALAGRIAAHRDASGPFERLDDLDAVPGIGATLLARIEGQACPIP